MDELQEPNKRIVEIFGYSPTDKSRECRALWNLGACPFIKRPCHKTNHDKSVVYGACSVTTPYGDCVICPNRLYADGYKVLKEISRDAFGDLIEMLAYGRYIDRRNVPGACVVALGMYSGKEVKAGRSLSMDWVLAKVEKGKLVEYVGVEVQSIDITGNYRDNWYAYRDIGRVKKIPESEHGLNWANVHKRLIPQLIRKGKVYSGSKFVKSGLYFVVPDIVYRKFEEIIGTDIPTTDEMSPNVMTVHTYSLSEPVTEGRIRGLTLERRIRFSLEEFSDRFISGPNLPQSSELDNAIQKLLEIHDGSESIDI
ncbi:MAG: hypothetical protein LBS92_07945 [Candidatus Methanoplasma sp.]|jgi:hypothetical protein|nr:hypothetical protein [Candidatus Methanoplasma sp.]